ncbi:MAG: hypothetical protein J0H82_04495 [Alphaproteobacteria bacterium]|jgi:hypothetical protein|nr:hypothetical protein [Alphaproteobacteria bacterium]
MLKLQGYSGGGVSQGQPRDPRNPRNLVSIEWLLEWTYRQQRAQHYAGRGIGLYEGERAAQGVEWFGHSADGVFEIERRAQIGGRIDVSGGDMGWLDDDAATVHDVVEGAPDGILVIRQAEIGGRPSWGADAQPRLRPVLDAKGKPEIGYWWDFDARDHRRYCPVIVLNSADEVAHVRAVYQRWARAVIAIRLRLLNADRSLRRHRLDQTVPPLAPWLDGGA